MSLNKQEVVSGSNNTSTRNEAVKNRKELGLGLRKLLNARRVPSQQKFDADRRGW